MLVLTLMVRDEADVIAATIEHHLDQGVDHILVTDNGSIDGTSEILADYARTGAVTVVRDDSDDYRQNDVVTAMARRAATELGADWVINGDADEFVVPLDRSLRLADVFARLDPAIGAFAVPVVNMVGRPARRGSGLTRLVLRDERPDEVLEATGVHAHPTPNAIHVGDPEIVVSFGNHYVSRPSMGEVPEALGLEVLHYPWRSWAQVEQKTVNMGLAFERNRDVRPSPKHHIMRDLRRWRLGMLEAFYLRRLPDVTGSLDGFVEDAWFASHMRELLGRARVPARLAAALDATGDEPYDDAELRALGAEAERLVDLDERMNAVAEGLMADVVGLHTRTLELSHEVVQYAADQDRLQREVAALREERDAAAGRASDAERRARELQAALAHLEGLAVIRARRLGGRLVRRLRARTSRRTDGSHA